MDFHLIKKIRQVKKAIYLNGEILALTFEKGELISENGNTIFLDKTASGIFSYRGNLLILDSYNRVIKIIDIDKVFDLSFIKDYRVLDVFKDNYLICYSKKNLEKFFGIVTDSLLVLSNKLTGRLFFLNNEILHGNSFWIKKLDLNCSELWQFAFSQLAPVYWDANTPDTLEKIIGVAHGNVWVTTDGGRLVAININTGELTKVFTRSEEEQIHGYECTHGLGWVYLNPNDSHIHCMSSFHYYKINTKTLSVDESYQYKELEPNGIGQFGIRQTLLQGDYFTFLGVKEGESQIRWAGIYDYKLRKTVWLHCVISDEELKKGNKLISPKPLRMAGNKLYIKDVKHNLHVFEKEEVVS